MKPMTPIDDDAPFASSSSFASGLAQLAGGEHARLGVEADQKRRFRLAIETWARAHELWSLEGQIVALFIITIAAAEVVVGLALSVRLSQRSAVVDPISELEAMLSTDEDDRPAAD